MAQETHLSHELFGGEDQLVVDEPARLLVEQRAVGVDVDRLLVLHCLVASFAEPRCVVEIPGSHRLERREQDTLSQMPGMIQRCHSFPLYFTHSLIF